MSSGTFAKAATHQGQLENVLEKLFKGQEILKNTRGDSKLKNPNTNLYLELDIWIPNFDICFEFQDEYHYNITWYNHKTLDEIQTKDKQKTELLRKRGDTIVVVPYWWSTNESELISTIRFVRPDLLQNYKNENCPPISLNPPAPEYGSIPDVGKLMPASFLISSLSFYSISKEDPWWMGEKYDGIRCCWNPRQRVLYSRTSRELVVPPSFVSLLSSIHSFVDAEMWFGRGNFSSSQALFDINSLEQTEWSLLRMVGFDEAGRGTQRDPFEARYESLLLSIPFDHPLLTIASRSKCESAARVERSIEKILLDNGEGIVLRRPNSIYHTDRSNDLLKIKAARGDLEGLVTSVNDDYTVTIALPDGVTFQVTVSKIQPKKGDVVTFSYDNYSGKSVPLNPRIIRIRADMTWQEAVYNFFQQVPTTSSTPSVTSKIVAGAKKPHKFWVSEKGNNMRSFFINFAKEKNIDPFKPSSWYNLTVKSFNQYEGFSSVLHHFGGSFVKAITNLFPEIQFDKSKFVYLPHRYWSEMANRRKFLDSFAAKHKFNPLVASNWYEIPYQSFLEIKGGASLLSMYPGKSAAKAIMGVYPEIGLVQSKFSFIPRQYWTKEKHRRMFFEDFAKKKKFDPLIVDNWYALPETHFLVEQGASTVLSFHGGKLTTALSDLFPELSFVPSLFPSAPRTSFEISRHRRKFILFAKQTGFDPLVANNWYSVTKKKAISFPGINHVLFCYRDNLQQALSACFPELKFDSTKFAHTFRWIVEENRKNVFDDFAAKMGFDPLVAENWYNVRLDQFGSDSPIKTVLGHYNNSFTTALLQIYPDIGLKLFRFSIIPRNHWAEPANRREFFDNYAKEHDFDPLVPDNWYHITTKEMRLIKSAAAVLSYSQGSLVKAVTSLYPDIGLQEHKFLYLQKDHWPDAENRRAFFDDFALQNGFDPLIPSNWYSVSKNSLLLHKKAGSLLKYTKGVLAMELVSLYPDIGLEPHNLFTKKTIVQ